MSVCFLHYISPKYLSKNACNFAIMPSSLAARLPPPKRETGGRMRSTSVPVVFNTPSRKELSTNLRVSSGLSFSSAISVSRSVFFCSVSELYPVVHLPSGGRIDGCDQVFNQVFLAAQLRTGVHGPCGCQQGFLLYPRSLLS